MTKDHQDDTAPPSDIELSVKALESLLVEKGLVDQEAVDALLELHENEIGPSNGRRVVARAWADGGFKRWLLDDPNGAIASMGYVGSQGDQVRVLENTDDVHNLVVCTLCSCYPWPLLGLPPVWYKSAPYRAQAVADPRGVMRQFGSEIGDNREVRVWDSTSEMRYLVLPQRPPGAEGWCEEELRDLVTRNSMIGVEEAQRPATTQTP
ncbi:MAG: nitrile hydratase subunit alpha [Chloroflexi bacterium]|nr:nitrile hydratase subunit alpha [Chloroflexota bacterium]